jgi:hypothetical protein
MEKGTQYSNPAAVAHPTRADRVIPVVMPMARGARVYGYTNGQLTTETWTVDGKVFVKTYTYTAGVLTGESDWVAQ